MQIYMPEQAPTLTVAAVRDALTSLASFADVHFGESTVSEWLRRRTGPPAISKTAFLAVCGAVDVHHGAGTAVEWAASLQHQRLAAAQLEAGTCRRASPSRPSHEARGRAPALRHCDFQVSWVKKVASACRALGSLSVHSRIRYEALAGLSAALREGAPLLASHAMREDDNFVVSSQRLLPLLLHQAGAEDKPVVVAAIALMQAIVELLGPLIDPELAVRLVQRCVELGARPDVLGCADAILQLVQRVVHAVKSPILLSPLVQHLLSRRQLPRTVVSFCHTSVAFLLGATVRTDVVNVRCVAADSLRRGTFSLPLVHCPGLIAFLRRSLAAHHGVDCSAVDLVDACSTVELEDGDEGLLLPPAHPLLPVARAFADLGGASAESCGAVSSARARCPSVSPNKHNVVSSSLDELQAAPTESTLRPTDVASDGALLTSLFDALWDAVAAPLCDPAGEAPVEMRALIGASLYLLFPAEVDAHCAARPSGELGDCARLLIRATTESAASISFVACTPAVTAQLRDAGVALAEWGEGFALVDAAAAADVPLERRRARGTAARGPRQDSEHVAVDTPMRSRSLRSVPSAASPSCCGGGSCSGQSLLVRTHHRTGASTTMMALHTPQPGHGAHTSTSPTTRHSAASRGSSHHDVASLLGVKRRTPALRNR